MHPIVKAALIFAGGLFIGIGFFTPTQTHTVYKTNPSVTHTRTITKTIHEPAVFPNSCKLYIQTAKQSVSKAVRFDTDTDTVIALMSDARQAVVSQNINGLVAVENKLRHYSDKGSNLVQTTGLNNFKLQRLLKQCNQEIG